MNVNLVRKLGATALGLLLIVYVVYQAFLINADHVVVETALYASMSDTIEIDAWFAKNEEYVTNDVDGILSFKVENGEKLSSGDVVADIYINESNAADKLEIEKLKSEVEDLELLVSAGRQLGAATEQIGAQINATLSDLLSDYSVGDFDEANSEREELQYYLNQKNLITEKESLDIYNERIQELNSEILYLETSSPDRWSYVASPAAGYFIYQTDGYENSFDLDDIENISVSDIENLQKRSMPSDAIGKVSTDFTWYVVAIIDEQQKIQMENKTNVQLFIPNATKDEIPATVVSINKEDDTGMYSLVISCDYMTPEIAPLRNESVQVVTGVYSGVLINENAIHFSDVTVTERDENNVETQVVYENVKGVYVKYGNRISFVQVFTDITINGYAVCRTELTSADKEKLVTWRTVILYDEIVVEGSNIYDGKML